MIKNAVTFLVAKYIVERKTLRIYCTIYNPTEQWGRELSCLNNGFVSAQVVFRYGWIDVSSRNSSRNSSPHRRHRQGSRQHTDFMKNARELFCWKGRQKVLAMELWEALDREEKEAQMEALVEVLASFIFEPVGDRPFSSGLVHFLAVLGIDAEMDRLREAKHYSYMLAGVVYCVRVLGVEKLLPAARRDEQTDED